MFTKTITAVHLSSIVSTGELLVCLNCDPMAFHYNNFNNYWCVLFYLPYYRQFSDKDTESSAETRQ